MPAYTLDDVKGDFVSRMESVDPLTIVDAWEALLANAECTVIRHRTPATADDYLEFSVTRAEDDRVAVAVQRRIAVFTEAGDYDGTYVLACYFRAALDPVRTEDPGPWSAEGFVSGYDQLEDEHDRPDLSAFRDEVETSASFRAVTHARTPESKVTSHWA